MGHCECQRDTAGHKNSLKEILAGGGLRRLRPSAAVGAGAHVPKVLRNSDPTLSSRRMTEWGSCEQFLYLIKNRSRRVGQTPPAADRNAGARTQILCLFVSCRVLRGVGTPPRTSWPAPSQPSRSWRWRDSNLAQNSVRSSTSTTRKLILSAISIEQSGSRWHSLTLAGMRCRRAICVKSVSRFSRTSLAEPAIAGQIV
jgi:hypothetical protein